MRDSADIIITRLEAIERKLNAIQSKLNKQEKAQPNELVGVKEAMAITALSQRTIYNLIGNGELNTVKRGRRRLILKSSLANYTKS